MIDLVQLGALVPAGFRLRIEMVGPDSPNFGIFMLSVDEPWMGKELRREVHRLVSYQMVDHVMDPDKVIQKLIKEMIGMVQREEANRI